LIRPAALLAVLALAGQDAVDRDRAVAELHRRAENVAPGSPAAREVAAGLATLGRRCLSEGQPGCAVELLGEALALDDRNGLVLAELTLAFVRSEDFESARFYLKRAEAGAAGAPPEIYGVLGDVYDGLHRLEDAIDAWTEFARLGGQDPERLARLARVREERALARGQRSLSTDHFGIFADVAVSEGSVSEAAVALEGTYGGQASLLGARLDSTQIVVLHAGRHYFSLVSAPDWASGLFDGKIRVTLAPDGAEPAGLAAVLAHELAHVLVRVASRGTAPAWLHEGVAQWCEGRRLPARSVSGALGDGPAGSLDALERRFRRKLDAAAARATYAEALSVVEYLLVARGDGALRCVLARLAQGRSLPEALRREAGLSPEELYAGWRRWVGV
jgi:tetratricopeptide (TPR) repeat protein